MNGKAGDLTIDTGAPTSVVYRATLKKFGLTVKDTENLVHGAFGKGTEKIGITTISQLAMGNCTLMNVKAALLSDQDSGGIYRTYGTSDGLFGLREMFKYGAVLDLANSLLLVHPGGQQRSVSAGMGALLAKEGYTAVDLTLVDGQIRAEAKANGTPVSSSSLRARSLLLSTTSLRGPQRSAATIPASTRAAWGPRRAPSGSASFRNSKAAIS